MIHDNAVCIMSVSGPHITDFCSTHPITLSSCPPIFAVFFIFSLGLSFNVELFIYLMA